ncbi:TasA family protein [Nocardioides sp. 503]|uniref:TasA family protein n=1 Tax=Nocardioides sp. 503 TaxID=2508326 RepID=UPI00106F87E8|nr:TasA family protein [Nocardioides sp. 503]
MKKSALTASSTKILASVVLVAGAASVAGLGTFGAFTSTTSASEAVGTGKVVLGLTQHASLGTTVAATNLVPGDTVQRAVVLTRSNDTEAFGSVKLTTAGGTANKLTTDQTDGLKLAVDQCTTGWTKATGSNDLTCVGGTVTNLIASRPVVGTNLDLAAATTALNSNAAAANLRVTLTLPEAADNTFQGLSNTVAFTFDATQRAATSK